MINIDGTNFDVPVIAITRKADFLDKYADRTLDGTLRRELIGVYFNYQLKFGRVKNATLYASLWAKLTEATEFHDVTVPDESGDFTFTAYFSGVGDSMFKAKNARNFWENLTVDFIAKAPERVP